jgi:NAD(P)-dependent dehydrogenase (short-subunit alcohol dehydrogenase family)
MTKKICLITGANRGIGLEIAAQIGQRGHRVLLGARDIDAGDDAAKTLRDRGIDARVVPLDVTDPDSVRAAAAAVEAGEGRLDVLVNNAGIFLDSIKRTEEVELDLFRRTIEVNLLGAFTVGTTFLPLLRKSEDGRLINMSSDLGSLAQASDPESRYNAVDGPAYRVSKAALNMLALAWAKELRGTNVAVSVCSPGWCRTGLDPHIDSSAAPNSAADGADTAVWLALDMDRSQHGRFYAKRREIAW